MIDDRPPSPPSRRLPLDTRAARRWLRGAWMRLSGAAPVAYRPNFSLAAVVRTLGRASSGRAAVRGDDAILAAARDARTRFGPRFFLTPESIPSLWQHLERDHPHWCRTLTERTAADAAAGIPLYGTTGPVLGPDFPWSRLASGAGGDMLYPLRPHRFAFAPRTALACLYDGHAAARLRATLDAWIAAASAGDRHCYASNLLVIQRILALSWCWAFLAARPLAPGGEGAALELRVLGILLADVRFLEPRLGQSAPNNHLLADRFAGWYLRAIFPEFLCRDGTGDEAAWQRELLAQTYTDGGSFEHSAHYHEFACEMGAAYLLLCRRLRRAPDPGLAARTGALLRFQLGLSGPGATPLLLGNGAEDTLFPLDAGEGWCPGALRELYRVLFDPAVSAAPSADASAIRAYWLLGGELAQAPIGRRAGEPDSFPDSGLYLQHDLARDARLAFRTGPSPDVAVAAGHMHADLLGIYLSVADEPLLVDAGTYSYRRSPQDENGLAPDWRRYFAGPAAHNGLAIAGSDPLGDFDNDFRSPHTATRVIARRTAGGRLDLVDATLRAPAPYDGARRACLHLQGQYWLIVDVPPPGLADGLRAWYGFQCAHGVRVAVAGHCTTISGQAGGTLTVLASAALDAPQLLEGSLEPPGGWVSPCYGRRVPAPQVRYAVGRERAPSAFLMAVDAAPGADSALDVEPLATGAVCARIRRGDVEDLVVLDGRTDRRLLLRHDGFCFDGHLLWLRLREGRPVALQWFDASRFSWQARGIALEPDPPRRRDLVLDGADALAAAAASFRRFEWPEAPAAARP